MKERRNNAASAFGGMNIDAKIKGAGVEPEKMAETIEKKEVSPVEETQKTTKEKTKGKTGTSITLDNEVLETMRLFCTLEKENLSTIVNDFLKNEYIPKNKVKSKIRKYMDSF